MSEFQVGDKVRWNKSASEIAWEIGFNANMSYAELEGLSGIVNAVLHEYDDGAVYEVAWSNQHTSFEWAVDHFEITLVSHPTVGKDRYSKTLFD